MQIHPSPQFTLVAAGVEHLRVELEVPGELAALLRAVVSPSWPPGEYDHEAMAFFRARLEAGGEDTAGWYGWYAICEGDGESARTLVGAGGYMGPPDAEGTVEIGYSVLPEFRGRGYASQMVAALVARAFGDGRVRRVVAHTTEANTASVAVLVRCGFERSGAGREAGTVRFVRDSCAPAGG